MPSDLPRTRDVINGAFGMVKEYAKLTTEIANEDYSYHVVFPGFRRQVIRHSRSLVTIMNKCCRLLPERRRPTLPEDAESVTALQRAAVMEAADSLLENVDGLLDELRGRRLSARDQLSVKFGSELEGALVPSAHGISGAHVLRPQLTFDRPVDNSSAPFCPMYHDENGTFHVGEPGVHPFAEQIKSAPIPEEQLLRKAETPFLPLSSCPLTFVDTVAGLEDLVKVLLIQGEIAVDLEHHDFYSYQGFTCLVQISTRTQDFIIDCLKLRASMHLLSPVFLSPRIIKVLHGAREDIRWLQKDFGIYVVNLFDTSIALQQLHMPYSLAFAVDHFCQVKLDKKYQTADWRVRPIPIEMVSYAQQDTHFLLYIYDRLCALLLNCEARPSVGNLLLHVFQESRLLSLERYEKPVLEPDVTYKVALGRSLGGLSKAQLQVAQEIFNWRDGAAREADDSPSAVMHLSSVLSIATRLPSSANDVLRCCSPVSVIVRTNVMKLLQIVKDAVGGADETAIEEAESGKQPGGLHAGRNVGGAMRLPTRLSGVHRPMTGTLPSIERHACSPVTLDKMSPVAYIEPSVWFKTMCRISAALRSKVHHSIALPGHETVVHLLAAKKARETTMKERSEQLKAGDELPSIVVKEDNENAERGNEVPRQPVVREGAHVALTDVGEGSTIVSEAGRMQLKGRAIALRQKYGTGSANRKRAKLEKSQGDG
ncbi:PMC2NT domain [Trypanosoma vivax]|uniref:Putative ribosomal RNA processing protein 6 n=1 Tax=Trypanosoma vivax (strain Y486) TaxID=1055687 RepID=G0TU32_TRYVY|nr:PMC2NT domain [Trypanosoma vivax]CCC47466.1 putative ribosomal RNA processing protein 6 [Trypanosoma vivax Y486]